MSKNPAAVGPFCYFVPLLHTLRNRSVLQSRKKYDIHTYYGDKYVTVWTIRLKNALIWLASLAIQHEVRTPLHFAIFCVVVFWRWTSFGKTTTRTISLKKCQKELLNRQYSTEYVTVLPDMSRYRWRCRRGLHERRRQYDNSAVFKFGMANAPGTSGCCHRLLAIHYDTVAPWTCCIYVCVLSTVGHCGT